MNAPIILAQLTGSQQTAAPPRTIRIEKPQNDQAVSIRLDGNTKLDLSGIASEKLTFVRIGERLIVLFDNQSTVTIDPMFDGLGNPLPNVAFEVGPDRIVNGTDFAALFPITTDQSVLPAAGAAASGPAAGANFSDPNAGSLDGSGARLALLGDETGGGGLNGDTDPGNPQPLFGTIALANLDDEGLDEGNLGGPGDVAGADITVTNSLNVDFGTDRAGAYFLFSAAQPTLAGLTSGGQPITIVFINNVAGGTPTIIGYVGADPTIAANQVFTITLDNNPLNGAYTFTLLRPLDHPTANTEDTITLTIGFSATDGTGDTGFGSFGVAINDDSPELAEDQQLTTTVDEDGLLGGNTADADGDVAGADVTATGTLGILWGADNFDTSDVGGVQDGSTGAALTGRALFFTDATVLVGGVAAALTSHGDAVTFALSNNGTTLTASAGARTIFTVSLSDDGTGSYTFTLLDELDHPTANTEDDLNLQFNFTARDSDSDTIGGTFSVIVDDDSAAIGATVVLASVDEDDLSNGNDTPKETLVSTAALTVAWGADNDTRGLGDTVGRTLAFAASGLPSGLTSDGVAIVYGDVTSLDNGGVTVTAYKGTVATGNEVFTVTLDPTSATGSATFELLGNLDHATGGAEAPLNLSFSYLATDADGDTAAQTGIFTIDIVDDLIVQGKADNVSLDEESLKGGNTGEQGTGTGADADLSPNPGLTVGGSLGVSWGADDDTLGDAASVAFGRAVNFVTAAGVGTLLDQSSAPTGADLGLGVLTSDGVELAYRIVQTTTVGGDWDGGYQLIAYKSTDLADPPTDLVFTVTLSATSTNGSYTFELLGNLDHALPPSGTASQENDLDLTFHFRATDADGDTGTAATFTVTVDDDAPLQVQDSVVTKVVDEDDLADFNPFYIQGVPVFGLLQGSLGTSPFDGTGPDQSITGLLGTVPVWGDLSPLVNAGADSALASFHLVSETQAELLLQTIGPNGGVLTSHGDVVDEARFVNIPGVGEILGFFASDGRLVAGLFVSDEGTYNFRLFDQIDHPVGDNPATTAFESVQDVVRLDLSAFVQYSDGDGDTLTLKPASFSVDIRDDAPIAIGSETGSVNENDLADFNPLYPFVFDFLQGSLGTSPFDGFTDGSITGLFGTVPVYGFLTDNVIGGADEFGKFALVSDTRAETLLATLNGGAYFTSHGDNVNDARSIDIPGLGEATGFFASDGRLVFGLFISEAGFYNFRLFDQLDHALTDNPATAGVVETAFADTLAIDLSKFVTFTDFDGDTIDLGAIPFVISVVDDIPVLTGQSINVTLDESDLNNFLPGWDLIPAAIKALYPIEGSAGSSPDGDTDALLLNSTGKQGFLNEIIGTNLVNGGADEFGQFGIVSDARANFLLTHDLAGWTSKGEAIDHVQSVDLGLIGDVLGFFAGDRLVFALTINPTGFYDIRLFDQIDHPLTNNPDTVATETSFNDNFNLDLSQFVTYTDFDGDAIDLGTGHLVLTVIDDAPIASGVSVTATVEEEQFDPINALLGSDLTHGNEDTASVGGEDQDTDANPLSLGSLITTNITFGSLAALVKVGADDNGTFAFDTAIAGQLVKDSTGASITSHGQAVEYGFRNGQLVGYVDLNNNNAVDGSERIVFTVSLSELPFGIVIPGDPIPSGLLDGIVNDQFTFTLLDAIDHNNPNGASTEDIKRIDLSSTIKFTDADGDTVGFASNSFEIKAIDDTPRQTGLTIKGIVEEEHNAGGAFPEVNHGNEDLTPDPQDGDFSTTIPFIGTVNSFDITTNRVTGNLSSLVSVGADEVTQTAPLVIGGITILPGFSYGTFSFGDVSALPVIKSKGDTVLYAVTDANNDGLGDTLTATAGGRTVFTLTIVSNGTSSGSYTFTLLDQIDHANGGGENIANLDFSSLVRFADFDGDIITLTAGSFSIDVIDDQPVLPSSPATARLDDEGQALFTPVNDTPSDGFSNVKTVHGNAKALFSIGADDQGSVVVTSLPAFAVIYKDANGFALSEDVAWGIPSVATNGTVTLTATSIHYPAGTPAAVLVINIDGSYDFTLNAPVVQPVNPTEDTLALVFNYTATDFDQDSVSGTLTVSVNDDTPVSKGAVQATVTLDDDIFAGGNAGGTNDVADASVATGVAGSLFTAGADGLKSVELTSQTGFRAIYKDANGFAAIENLSWSSGVVGVNGATTFTGTGVTSGNTVATLTINSDGSYKFTTFVALVQPNAATIEENLGLTFNYKITDGDNDTVTGSLTVQVNDDTPVSVGDVQGTVTLDDDIFAGGNAGGTNDVADASVATGVAGSLFTAGADGLKSVELTSQTGFRAIYKDANGFAAIENLSWSSGVVGTGGATTFTGTGVTSGNTVATLTIGSDGSYKFTTFVALVQPNAATIEENLGLTFNYKITDGDNDTVTGSLTVQVNDDTPVSVGDVQGTVTLDDDIFAGGNAGGTNDVADASVATGVAGSLFTAGADGLKSVELTSQTGFRAIYKDANGFAAIENLSWSSGVVGTGGATTFTGTGVTSGNTVATLTIGSDGSYKFTTFVALVQPNAATIEENLGLTFNYKITDGDNDTVTGSLTVQVNDDTPVSVGDVQGTVTLDDDIFAGGNAGGTNDVADASVATGVAGSLFTAGADGLKSVELTSQTGFKAIYKDANGIANSESLSWSAGVVGTGGATTFTGTGVTSGNTVATLTIGSDGSYKFTTFAALVHPNKSSIEENLGLTFNYKITDGDNDTVTGSLTVQVNDDTPIINVANVQNGFVDEERLPGGNAGGDSSDLGAPQDDGDLTATGTLGISYGADGPAAVVGSAPTNTTANFDNFPQGGNGSMGTVPYVVGTYSFFTDQGIVNPGSAGQIYGNYVDITNSAGPFTVGSLSLGLFGTSLTGFGEVRLTGTPSAGGSPIVVVLSGIVISGLGSPSSPFNLSSTALGGVQLNSLKIEPVEPGPTAFNGSVVVDNVALGSGGGGVSDGPLTFTDQIVAANNVTITNTNGTVDLATLTSDGGPVLFKLLDAVTLVAYTGSAPATIDATNVVFSAVLSGSGTGSYTFVQKNNLDHPLSGEDDLVIKLNYTAKDFDGDGQNGSFTVTVDDDAPSVPSATTVLAGVDEDDLTGGNDTPPGPETSVTSAALGVSWGSDNDTRSAGDTFGRTLTFDTLPSGLTSDGVSVVYSTTPNANGGVTVIAYKQGTDSSIEANQVFIVTIDPTTTNGTATFTLKGNLDHGGAGEDSRTLNFTFKATDADGDTATQTGTFAVTVNDDVATFGTIVSTSIDEENVPGIGGNVGGGNGDLVTDPGTDVTGPPAARQVTGTFGISWGSDNANSVFNGGFNGTVVNGDRSLVFASDAKSTLEGLGLKSDGVTLAYTIGTDGTLLTATKGLNGSTVFTVSLSDDLTGSYAFRLFDNLDHATETAPGTENDQILTFKVTARDGDGDAANASFTVTVDDDAPTSTDTTATFTENATFIVDLTSRFSFGADNGPAASLSLGTPSYTGVPSGVTLGQPTSILLSNGIVTVTPGTAFDALPAGQTAVLHIPFTVTDGDGDTVTKDIAITITGVNDPAVITPVVADITETNAILTTGGTVAISDVDSPATFIAQSNVAGSNGYGRFTLGTDGVWSYSTDTAHNEFVAGTTYTDALNIVSADGTPSTITVRILGTNDAAVITPVVADITETNAILTTGGTVAISDVDSPATFIAQSNVAGSNGYGHFTLGTDGVWSYSTDTAHNEFVAGTTYTDALNIVSADGTPSTITVRILGTNDAATITGADSGSVTEAITNGSPGIPTTAGDLNSTDVDNTPNDAWQVVSSATNTASGYGSYTVSATGVWTYTLNNANPTVDALNNGQQLTDTFNVLTADGTSKLVTITINGATDALPPTVIVNDSPYYAFVGTSPAAPAGQPTSINFNANDIFGGGSDTFNFSFQNVFGSAAGLSGATGVSTSGIVTGTPALGLNVFRIDATDRVTGETSFTYVAFSGIATNSGTYIPIGTNANAGNTFTTDVVEVLGTSAFVVNTQISSGSNFDVLIGNNNANWLTPADGNDAIYGRGGNDRIDGGGNTNFISGGDGNDTITAGSSASYLLGGAGDDTITGSGNFDFLLGGDGNDTLRGGSGGDLLSGGDGNDTFLDVGTGPDIVDAGAGDDLIVVTANQAASLNGGSGNDTLRIEVNSFNAPSFTDDRIINIENILLNVLPGNSTDFSFANQTENLTIRDGTTNSGTTAAGGSGNDTFVGGLGSDTFTGNGGADRFVYAETGAANRDTIIGYSASQGDVIDLSALLGAGTGAAADGSNINSYVRLTQNGSNILVQADVDGAGAGGFADVATLQGYGTGGADIVRVVFQNVDHQISV